MKKMKNRKGLTMEDKIIKLFDCKCECVKTICDIIVSHNINTDDYTEILIELKKWIEDIIED